MQRRLAELGSQLRAQLQRTFLTILLVWIGSLAVLGFVVLIHRTTGVSLSYLMADPAVTAGTGIFIGFLSNLGVVLWTAAAAICLFSAAVMDPRRGSGRLRPFLLSAGLLTAFLMLDDLFLFHEGIFPYLIGVPIENLADSKAEIVVFGAYGVLILVGLVVFARTILETEFLLLGMALGFLGLSIVVDILTGPRDRGFPLLMEDGFKFMAIASWLAYFAHVAAAAVRPLPERSPLSASAPRDPAEAARPRQGHQGAAT